MNQNKISNLICGAALAGIVLSFSACSGVKNITTESSNVVSVDVIKPEIMDIYREKDFVGRIMPDQMVAVMPTMPDKVVSINKSVGDYVNKGDLLFEVDNEASMQRVEIAKSGLEIAMIQADQALGSSVDMSVLQAELAYKSADLEYDKVKDEFDILDDKSDGEIEAMGGDDVYDAQIDSMKTKLKNAQTTLHYAKESYERAKEKTYDETKDINDASVKKAEVAYKTALDAMDETKVFSPVSGVIQESNVSMHETPSMNEPSMVIAGDNIMTVNIGLPEKYINNVDEGALVNFKYGDKVYSGTVTEVGVAANEKSGLVDVKVSVQDAEGVFATGATITVNLVVESSKQAMVIPYKALYIENDEAYVFINNDGAAEKRVVKLGVVNDKYAEILIGVSSYDNVIATKSSAIGEGVSVIERNSEVVDNTVTEEADK